MDWLTRHAKTLHACDFFTKRVWTMKGPVDFFALVFLHVGTRRLHIIGSTANPNTAWVTQYARNYILRCDRTRIGFTHLIHGHDATFSKAFTEVFKPDGIDALRVGLIAPNLNAYCERVIQTIQLECMDHFTVFGKEHLRWLCREFEDHYNSDRPHKSLGNTPLGGTDPPISDVKDNDRLVCRERLGGLIKSYCWVA